MMTWTIVTWCLLLLVGMVMTKPGRSSCRWCYDVSDSWGGVAYRCGRCRRVPHDLPTNITWLGLPAFQGHALSANDFKQYPRLVDLRLHKSLVRQVAEETLTPLVNLRMLMLTGGRLHTVPRQLPASLQTLELQGNHLRDVPSLRLPKLVQLDLSSNHIHHIAKETLHHLPLLRTLILYNNRLRHADLSHLGNLKTVVLSSNHLVTMPKLPASVEFVRLGFNKIGTLPALDLPSLSELYVDNNNLSSLDVGSLRALPKLGILDLSGNPLGDLDPAQFEQLPHLNNIIVPDGRVIHPRAEALEGARPTQPPKKHSVKQYVWIIVLVSSFTFLLTVAVGMAIICFTQRKRVFVQRAKVHRVRKACSAQKLLVDN